MTPVALRIEDYGIIGDTHTAALVGRNGSIDWLCLPRFDSDACFAGILGDDSHGYWRISPATEDHEVRRRYRGDSLVLETEFETADGVAKVVDCMPIREDRPQVVRMVEAVRGEVAMVMRLVIRFGYGSMVPWVRRADGLLCAVAGPDALSLWTPIGTRGEDMTTVAEFTVSATEHIPFVLTWYPSHEVPPRPVDASYAVHDTQGWWEDWAAMCNFEGEWRDPVMRSLITL
jgi:GH15 family glucan-1,4-alpha-glucosidase